MRKLILCAAAGAVLLTLVDAVAAGNDQKTAMVPQSTSQSVDRTLKADRETVLHQEEARHAPPTSTHERSTAQRPHLLDGCELPVSPLSESASISGPARCIS
jgi:hypothetical protein